MKEQLIKLWKELKARRQLVIQAREKSKSNIGREIYGLLANEQATIMDALNDIITKHEKG